MHKFGKILYRLIAIVLGTFDAIAYSFMMLAFGIWVGTLHSISTANKCSIFAVLIAAISLVAAAIEFYKSCKQRENQATSRTITIFNRRIAYRVLCLGNLVYTVAKENMDDPKHFHMDLPKCKTYTDEIIKNDKQFLYKSLQVVFMIDEWSYTCLIDTHDYINWKLIHKSIGPLIVEAGLICEYAVGYIRDTELKESKVYKLRGYLMLMHHYDLYKDYATPKYQDKEIENQK